MCSALPTSAGSLAVKNTPTQLGSLEPFVWGHQLISTRWTYHHIRSEKYNNTGKHDLLVRWKNKIVAATLSDKSVWNNTWVLTCSKILHPTIALATSLPIRVLVLAETCCVAVIDAGVAVLMVVRAGVVAGAAALVLVVVIVINNCYDRTFRSTTDRANLWSQSVRII